MKSLLGLCFILSLVSCGKHVDPKFTSTLTTQNSRSIASTLKTSDTFLDYRDRFYDLAEEYGVEYEKSVLQESELKTEAYAVCNMTDRISFIDMSKWLLASEELREIIVFHEMGHCSLSRPHFNNEISLMNSDFALYSVEDYKEHRQEFLDELFLKRPITYKQEQYESNPIL